MKADYNLGREGEREESIVVALLEEEGEKYHLIYL